jgi:hypothetical protein
MICFSANTCPGRTLAPGASAGECRGVQVLSLICANYLQIREDCRKRCTERIEVVADRFQVLRKS